MTDNAGQSIFAATLSCLVLSAVIVGGVVEASAMGWFGGHHGSAPPSQSLVFKNDGTSNNSNHDSITANPVVVNPEPSTIVLLASGLLGLGVWRLRRKH